MILYKTLKIKCEHISQNLHLKKSQRLNEYLQNVDTIFNTLNTHFSADKFATDIFVASTPRPYSSQVHATINHELQEFFSFQNSDTHH